MIGASAAPADAATTTWPADGSAAGLPRRTYPRALAMRAFVAILHRDLVVTGKEIWLLIIQVAVIPTFLLFIFAKLLTSIGYVSGDLGSLLLPGIVALAAFLTSLHSVAHSLVADFGWTREIEDRLLAPLSTTMVGLEKLVIGALRGLLAAAFMFPIGALVLGVAPWRPSGLPNLILALTLGAWTGAALGVTVATFVRPARTTLVFELVFTPLPFTGAVQYPFTELDRIPWFQVVAGLNPMTYCAEGVRAALVPEIPHLNPVVSLAAQAGFAVVLTATSMWGFHRRAVT